MVEAHALRSVLGEPIYWWVLVFIFSLFLAVAAYHDGKENLLSGANDFAPVYAATTLVGTPDIYNPDKIDGILTRELGGSSASLRFNRLPFPLLSKLAGRSRDGC